jgi:hypothetical protein
MSDDRYAALLAELDALAARMEDKRAYRATLDDKETAIAALYAIKRLLADADAAESTMDAIEEQVRLRGAAEQALARERERAEQYAVMIRRLAHACESADLPLAALDLLRRTGGLGSPLRDAALAADEKEK